MEGSEEARVRLPQLRLDELLEELQARLDAARGTRDRVHSLLEAVLSVGRELDLEQALLSIVEAAAVLVDAEYAALGVIAPGRQAAVGLPHGRGHRGADRPDRPLSGGPRHPGGADPPSRAVAAGEDLRASRLLRLPGAPPADEHLPRRPDPGARPGLRQPVPDREAGRWRSSTRRTSRSSRRWPWRPASRSTTPVCTRSPGCASAGCRRMRRSPTA